MVADRALCARADLRAARRNAVGRPAAARRDGRTVDATAVDGCRGEVKPEAQGIDTMRAGLQRGVCSTARFVDRIFGRENQFSEYEDHSNGRAGVTLGWDEQDGFEVDTRFRASVNLPQINERFNATIGRATSDEYLADENGHLQPGGRRILRRRSGRMVRGRRLPGISAAATAASTSGRA